MENGDIYGTINKMDIVPLYRLTEDDLECIILLRNEFPNMTIKEILDKLEIEGDFSEYGT